MIDIYAEAHDPHPGRLNEDEKDRLFDWVKSKNRPLTLKEARAKQNGAGAG